MAFYCDRCGYRAERSGTCPTDRSTLLNAPFGSMLGEKVGGLTIVGKLGAGGMGVVYRAIDSSRGAAAAVKVLNASCATDATAKARFLREAQAVNKIPSGGLARVTDAGVLGDGMPYFVMELLEGESLGSLLARTAQPPLREVYRIMLEVLAVVAAAHSVAVVHRDLKPENIFLAKPTRVVVLDFGTAKLLDSSGEAGLTSTNSTIGTPAYMPPEQIRRGTIDARTDVYALSVILYEMIAGRRPFLGSEFEVMQAHVSRKPAPPRAWFPEIPVDLQSIVLAGLAKDPDHRFQSVNAMRKALEHVASK